MRWGILLLFCLACSAVWADLGRVAYVADGALWEKDLPDGAPRAVAYGNIEYPVWSTTSGEWLSYRNRKTHSESLISIDGSVLLTTDEATHGAWSPVSDTFAFTTSYGGLFLYDAKSQSTRTLVSKTAEQHVRENSRNPIPSDADKYVATIVWSPDGRILAALTEYGGLLLVNTSTGQVTIVQRSRRDRLIDRVLWNADGNLLVYVTQWMTENFIHHATLWRINANGSNLRLLLDPGREVYQPWLVGGNPQL